MERYNEIKSLVEAAFECQFLELVNESHMHSVPPNSETHFKLTLVSTDFDGKSKVSRHQAIYKLMGPLMSQGLHALALHTFTPAEWAQTEQQVPSSPNCMGGSKSAS